MGAELLKLGVCSGKSTKLRVRIAEFKSQLCDLELIFQIPWASVSLPIKWVWWSLLWLWSTWKRFDTDNYSINNMVWLCPGGIVKGEISSFSHLPHPYHLYILRQILTALTSCPSNIFYSNIQEGKTSHSQNLTSVSVYWFISPSTQDSVCSVIEMPFPSHCCQAKLVSHLTF